MLQPQAGYYVTRNLATALENLQPADFDFIINNDPSNLEHFKMSRKGEKVIALWIPGHADDSFKPIPINLEIAGDYKSAIGYDCLNGVTQELLAETDSNEIRIKGILINDYPLLVRLVEK